MKYERLTARSAKGLKLKNGKKFVELLSDKNLTLSALNRLAELEDKIESGKTVDLPCKVGDNIYFVRVTLKPYIVETYIDEICFKKDYILVHCAESGRYLRFDNDWNLIENYWNVYLDKYQAEARLKELQGE